MLTETTVEPRHLIQPLFVTEGEAPEPGEALRQGEDGRAGQVTSVLALPEGGWIGLALVRRAALEEPRLRTAGGAWLRPSIPDAVQAPPVGAGGRQAGGSP